MTMCMWKNHHTTDILGSKGSAHITISFANGDQLHLLSEKENYHQVFQKKKK